MLHVQPIIECIAQPLKGYRIIGRIRQQPSSNIRAWCVQQTTDAYHWTSGSTVRCSEQPKSLWFTQVHALEVVGTVCSASLRHHLKLRIKQSLGSGNLLCVQVIKGRAPTGNLSLRALARGTGCFALEYCKLLWLRQITVFLFFPPQGHALPIVRGRVIVLRLLSGLPRRVARWYRCTSKHGCRRVSLSHYMLCKRAKVEKAEHAALLFVKVKFTRSIARNCRPGMWLYSKALEWRRCCLKQWRK